MEKCCDGVAPLVMGRLCDVCEEKWKKRQCVDCKQHFKSTLGDWAELDFRCLDCEAEWVSKFKLHCSHCQKSLALKMYTECDKCSFALCGDCCSSGEIFHEHDFFTSELYMGSGPLTMMMSSLSGRRVVENRKEAFPEKGSCRFCKESGVKKKCARCKVFYCSPDCQKKDWERLNNHFHLDGRVILVIIENKIIHCVLVQFFLFLCFDFQ